MKLTQHLAPRLPQCHSDGNSRDQTISPVGESAVGRCHPRASNQPTAGLPEVTNGHAVSANPEAEMPSAWLPPADSYQNNAGTHATSAGHRQKARSRFRKSWQVICPAEITHDVVDQRHDLADVVARGEPGLHCGAGPPGETSLSSAGFPADSLIEPERRNDETAGRWPPAGPVRSITWKCRCGAPLLPELPRAAMD